jgi:hypothetical protein
VSELYSTITCASGKPLMPTKPYPDYPRTAHPAGYFINATHRERMVRRSRSRTRSASPDPVGCGDLAPFARRTYSLLRRAFGGASGIFRPQPLF